MDAVLLNTSLTIVQPVTQWTGPLLFATGSISMLFCALLSYVVLKHTPGGFGSLKIMVMVQLVGCFINSFLFASLIPYPVYPSKVFIFTGPFLHFGSRTVEGLFVGWIATLTFLSCAAMTFSFNHYIETMDLFKQTNPIFEFFRNLSIAHRLICYSVFNGIITIINSLALYFSIADEPDPSLCDCVFTHFQTYNAIIYLKSQCGTFEILGSTTLIFLIYFMILVFLIKNVFNEMEQLRPSLSPRTFEIIQQLTKLLIILNLTPIPVYFLPSGLFIVINFLLPNLVSTNGLLILFSVLTQILFSSYSFAYYMFLLIGFK